MEKGVSQGPSHAIHHFTDEATEAQFGAGPCLGSYCVSPLVPCTLTRLADLHSQLGELALEHRLLLLVHVGLLLVVSITTLSTLEGLHLHGGGPILLFGCRWQSTHVYTQTRTDTQTCTHTGQLAGWGCWPPPCLPGGVW